MADRREPVLRAADVPAWENPTLLEWLEQALRGNGRPSPERARLARGVNEILMGVPGVSNFDGYQKLQRGAGAEDYIGGGLQMLMGAGATPAAVAARNLSRKIAANGFLYGTSAGAPLEKLFDDRTASGPASGISRGTRRDLPPLRDIDLDGNELPPPSRSLPPLFTMAPRQFRGFKGGGRAGRDEDARMDYWDLIPLGKAYRQGMIRRNDNPDMSVDVADYLATELGQPRRTRLPISILPRLGIDPIGEGYEDGGLVVEPDVNDSSLDEEILALLLEWMQAQRREEDTGPRRAAPLPASAP
jgi:hypothetical protein